jgi:HK97 family phage prohead protease
MHKFSTEIAAKFAEHFENDDVKALIEETKAAKDTGTFEVVATTENLDRYQEVIKLDGWDVEHYRRNPVILWGHDHGKLIGMATSVEIIDGKMIVKGKFAPTEEGQEKRKLYEMGFLRATSVGFIEKEREGNLITKAELLELSFVSVPANPYALRLSMEKGVSVNELVTKGIMFVEKDEEAPQEEPETPQNEPESNETLQPDTKAVPAAIDALKAAIVALEALTKEQPEGDDEPDDEPEDDADAKEFAAMRKLLQDASTVIGEVLAEARQAIHTRRHPSA